MNRRFVALLLAATALTATAVPGAAQSPVGRQYFSYPTAAPLTGTEIMGPIRQSGADVTTSPAQILSYASANLLAGLGAFQTATVGTLRAYAVPASPPGAAQTAGYAAAGDGGDGLYQWNALSAAADDGCGTIKPAASLTGRWVLTVPAAGLSVKACGAAVDGLANDSAAWRAALAYLQAGGGKLLMPPGISLATGLTVTADNMHIQGQGSGVSTILAADLTSTVLAVTGSHVLIDNLSFKSAFQQAAGAFVSMTSGGGPGGDQTLQRFTMFGGFNGVVIPTGQTQFVQDGVIRNTTNNAIEIDGGNEQYIQRIVSDNSGAQSVNGIFISQTGAVYINSVSFIHAGNGLNMTTADSGHTLKFMFVSDSAFDTGNGCGILIAPAAGSTALGFAFTGNWTSGNTEGVCLRGAGVIDGVSFVNHRSFSNSNRGFILANQAATNILIDSAQISGGSNVTPGAYPGVEIGIGVGGFAIRNSRIGLESGWGNSQSWAIQFDDTTSTNWSIQNNDLRQNISGSIEMAGTTIPGNTNTTKIVSGNLPQAVVTVPAPTASPFTYVAQSNGQIILTGGTVTSLSLNHDSANIPMAPGATNFGVQAGDLVTVGYSGTSYPAMFFLSN